MSSESALKDKKDPKTLSAEPKEGVCEFSREHMAIILAMTAVAFRGGIVQGRRGYALLGEIEDIVIGAGGRPPSGPIQDS